MGETSENKPVKHICIGLLAHVDAGKTTLAEGILFKTGSIRKAGRVDHGDAFLDTEILEKERGITIFSKQARFTLGEKRVTLLDTPGHVDFSAEMERSLQVMDYAILLISGADGVQGHVETLWRLLRRYEVPVFLFINKMDQPGTDQKKLLAELQKRLSDRCLDFTADGEELMENLAMCEEEVLETYLESGKIEPEIIRRMICQRKVFPCYFGSALKLTGVETFLQGLEYYTSVPAYPSDFGARVYKISRDSQGNRLTHLKVTGGTLKVKMMICGKTSDSREEWEEKVDQIRIYSGASYQLVSEASSGTICTVTGLSQTHAGQGLGVEEEAERPLLEPVLNYQIMLPPECEVHGMLLKLRQLEEEIPELHILWNERLCEIHAQVMGEVQIEILQRMIRERFGVWVEFGSGSIVYKETIKNTVEGVGHFEPLRHYAEVHLLMEPGEPGSGLVFDTACSEDVLDRNWQRLILTHLEERTHPGVLTGSEITDMRITLVNGRAHLKHTEGGDFRQATYRAVRQGLKKAGLVLLEPIYEYRLEIPSEATGRALNDIQRMCGDFQPPMMEGDLTVITGNAPASEIQGYQREVTSYSRGRGHLTLTLKGYEPCHNPEEVIATRGYDSEKDTENPTGSVFCAHGAGFVVSWDQVEKYMHLENIQIDGNPVDAKEEFRIRERDTDLTGKTQFSKKKASDRVPVPSSLAEAKELEEIFIRTYGPVERKKAGFERRTKPVVRRDPKAYADNDQKYSAKGMEKKEEYLLVDGYNVIFAWDELRELAVCNIESARGRLMDILCNYQGYKKMTLILVFDAYKVKESAGAVTKYQNIYVVYTKEAETADQYIEKTVHKIGRKGQVTVATSDGLEQIIIMGQGARRLSARDLQTEIEAANGQLRENYLERAPRGKNYLLDHVSGEVTRFLEELRAERKKETQ
ncbi:MAG: TetM/TetW/TetO/TetS family tetracycline resistance ribosomal protection protein [Fusicatenibacter sp.]|nr:TetM/TetW/TetO/TetS family tetracycline resistance ribosomal protection protein [Fusicatenibacter sp.]